MLKDALETNLPEGEGLEAGGDRARGYADAVAVYLGLGTSKLADYNTTLAAWSPTRDQAKTTFARQALPMVWDYAEINLFAKAAGDLDVSIAGMVRALNSSVGMQTHGKVKNADAAA